MSTFHLSIISAEGKVYDDRARELVLPGVDGYFGVLASHAPLIGALKLGLAKVISEDGKELFFLVSNGYVDVAHNEASVLVGNAAPVKDREAGLELLGQNDPWVALEASNKPA